MASWSVIMIRTSFLLGFLFVLIDGFSSKIELCVDGFSFCKDMVNRESFVGFKVFVGVKVV